MSARNDRIRELYEAALKRPIGERATFVSSNSHGDEDLRLRVVALLTGQQDTELPGHERGTDGAPLLATGTEIGHYRIDGPLGAGGMGVVYRATDTKLNRPAAIKVLPESLADPEARRRFQREAQTASSLNHPHIVTVHDAGEYLGRQYLITEYVDGGTLRAWAARPRGWRSIVELLVGVADAVAVAHEAGIMHRDIKPENILLAKSGYAKLADFGLAKLLEIDPLADDAFAGLRPDAHSSLVGTAAYMSPEQAQGLPLDGRSDVYSFGLVLHELLSGVRPDAARALDQRHGGEPKALAPLGDGVPAELRTLVVKALEHDPADRYQTMRELVVDLRRVVRGGGAEARRIPYGWISAALLATLALGGYFFDTLLDTGGAPAVAVLPFVNETANPDDDDISEGLSDGLRDRLMELPNLPVQARASSVSFRGENVDPRTIAKSLGVGRLVNGSVRRRGTVLDVLVEVLDENGFAIAPSFRYERSEREFQAMQQEIAADISALIAPEAQGAVTALAEAPTAASETANMLVYTGRLYESRAKGELTVDEEQLDLAIQLYRDATQEDPNSIDAHARLAGALLYKGDVDQATLPLQRALDLGESVEPGSASVDLSYANYSRALWLLRNRLRGADEAYRQAIALNSNNADTLGAYAQWLLTHQRSNEADRYYRDAIEHDKQTLSRYLDYAAYLTTREDMASARELAREIAERFPNARGYFGLARVYENLGDLDVGIAWGLRALREEPSNAEIRSQIAELYDRIGDFGTATQFEPEPIIGQLFSRRLYSELTDKAEEVLFDHPFDSSPRYYLAFAYNAKEDFALAQRQFEALGFTPDFELTEGVEYPPILAYTDTLQALGQHEAARRIAEPLAKALERGMQNGTEKSWWTNVNRACAEAQLGRDADLRGDAAESEARYATALTSFDRIRVAQGLVWTPLILDSPCFAPLKDEPRYQALVDRLEQRQEELRERLPATLREYGVENVRP